MAVTLAHALSPLGEVFEPASYERFIERWADKKLTQREIEAISYALYEYNYIFKRARLLASLERADYAYSTFLQAKKNINFAKDEVLKQLLRRGIGENAWLAAVSYAFNEFASEVSTRSESGKMVFKLFMASLSVLRKELEPGGRKKTPELHDQAEGDEEETWDDEPEEALVTKLDPSLMTIEEQIQKFNLHRDTYL